MEEVCCESCARQALTSLDAAIKQRNLDEIFSFLAREDGKRYLNQPINRRWTPLTLAMKSGADEVILRALCEAGCDPNIPMLHSPLLKAVRTKNVKLFRLFLEYGGNPNLHSNLLDIIINSKCDPIIEAYEEYGIKCTDDSHRQLVSAFRSQKFHLISSVVKNIQTISREAFGNHRIAFRRMIQWNTPMSCFSSIYCSLFAVDCHGFLVAQEEGVSQELLAEIFNLFVEIYLKSRPQDKQYVMHDLIHGTVYNNIPDEELLTKALDFVIADLKQDFNLNMLNYCGDYEFREGRHSEQNLLVCAFRYGTQLLAEQLIKYGADLNLLKFEDLSLIYRFSNRDHLMRLLVCCGYRLPSDFDIDLFCRKTDFNAYVCYTGMQVDYYIKDKLRYLHKFYEDYLNGTVFSLQKCARMALIRSFGKFVRLELWDKLPQQIKKYLNFEDLEAIRG